MIALAKKSLLPHLTTSDCVSQCFSLLFLKLAVTLLDTRTWQSVMVFLPLRHVVPILFVSARFCRTWNMHKKVSISMMHL